jgi:hypothetical protein
MDTIETALWATPDIKDFFEILSDEDLIRLRHRSKKSGRIRLAQMLDAEIRKRGQ